MLAYDVQLKLNGDLCTFIDDYAKKFFPKPNGEGNRSEAIRQILTSVLKLQDNAVVTALLEDDLILNGDILVFLRKLVADHIEEYNLDSETHTLQ